MKYLHSVPDHSNVCYLDHRVVPEARAMFCAMMSRAPRGGIRQRYKEIVAATEDEDRLTTYPLHPRLQQFIDAHVGKYGHSSILELTGSPAIFIENISWLACYLLFDNPLVAGQEMSTRAIWRPDWKMAKDIPNYPDILDFHKKSLLLAQHEIKLWKKAFANKNIADCYGVRPDVDPFRPAFDRARWALPGTISTGCSLVGNVRVMGRVLRQYSQATQTSSYATKNVTEPLQAAYNHALPGLAPYSEVEAVNERGEDLHQHSLSLLNSYINATTAKRGHYRITVTPTYGLVPLPPDFPDTPYRQYLDPSYNKVRVTIEFICSVSELRDWHRHRTLYPLKVTKVESTVFSEELAPAQTLEEVNNQYNLLASWKKSKEDVQDFLQYIGASSYVKTAVVPFCQKVKVQACGGLRDVLYCLELRAHAHGANYEYKGTALNLLRLLAKELKK